MATVDPYGYTAATGQYIQYIYTTDTANFDNLDVAPQPTERRAGLTYQDVVELKNILDKNISKPKNRNNEPRSW